MAAASAPPCKQGDICSDQFGTVIDGQNLYFATSTTLSSNGGGVSTLNYWNGSEWIASATSTNAGPWIPTTNSPLSQTAIQSLTSGDLGKNATATVSKSLDKEEVPKTTQDNVVPGSANKAPQTTTGTDDSKPTPTDPEQQFVKEENDTFKEGTKTGQYGNAKYPLNLSSDYQDCIKFTILEYKPSLAQGKSSENGRLVTVDSAGNPTIQGAGKISLGTITLPIPAGINDSNTVGWQSNEINDLYEALGEIGQKYALGGAEAAQGAVNKATGELKGGAQSGDLQAGISGLVGKFITNNNMFQQRALGSMFNNNMELLFNSPGLRSFSFTFKLSPRNAPEAKEIMKIIRFFKQAMSVKRSKSSLLLKTPRTFAISYLSSNKQHPYLNKFKECALTTFNVDYTPEGQYMTYMSSNIDERSMISYIISMTFQELEPVFDDDYGAETTITNIGY